jgi:hypothetical protein
LVSFQTSLDCLCLGLVTGLAEEGKHVALVVLYTGLVEGVNSEYITAYAATLLEEVEQLADVVFIELGHYDAEVGYATIDVCEEGTELGHLVYLVDVLACEEVEAVEVLLICMMRSSAPRIFCSYSFNSSVM